MNRGPVVGIVVVHFGDETPTRACLASIASDPSPVDRHVVVTDNSGQLQAVPEWVTLLKSPHNLGFGAAVNQGIHALVNEKVDAYVVLNNDVELLPGYLSAAAQAFQGHRQDVGAVAGPLYLNCKGMRLWYAGGRINFLTGTVIQSTSHNAARRRRSVGFIPGAAFALNPKAWLGVGGFDPSYFLYNEDVDLCLRLRRAGWRLLFEPQMAAVHKLGQSTGSASRSALYLYFTARTRLRPFRPLIYRLYLALLHSGYILVRASAVALVRPPEGLSKAQALLKGHWEALRQLGRAPLGPPVPSSRYSGDGFDGAGRSP